MRECRRTRVPSAYGRRRQDRIFEPATVGGNTAAPVFEAICRQGIAPHADVTHGIRGEEPPPPVSTVAGAGRQINSTHFTKPAARAEMGGPHIADAPIGLSGPAGGFSDQQP